MLRHYAVIGAGFGDEGKGQITDFLCDPDKTVVRFNGGSQAGHTVETADGTRHVFSQIGSGAFKGAKTHLSRFMVVNPVYFMREYSILSEKLNVIPEITASNQCLIVTPWDVDANQSLEVKRGEKRHGSVGHGIFQTIQRSYNPDFRLTFGEVFEGFSSADDMAILYKKLCRIIAYYGYSDEYLITEDYQVRFKAFMGSCANMLEHISIELDDSIAARRECVFEGAQGLLLDPNSGFFPHVTPTYTGLRNIMHFLGDTDCFLQPVYVTRSFLTRHGEGLMYKDVQNDLTKNFENSFNDLPPDATNVVNPWQGNLRRSFLSIPQLRHAIDKDVYEASLINSDVIVNKFDLALTWANYKLPSREGHTDIQDILEKHHRLNFASYGKTSKDTVIVQNTLFK